jgi:hypothetical protein
MMPKVTKKPKPVEEPQTEEISYDFEVVVAQEDRAITSGKAQALLGWETETAYKERTGNEEGYGDEALLTDEMGDKILCTNNLGNRPFRETEARKYAQDILTRNWAGPTSMPGETVNGETIIIGRTGKVMSGQHRLIGLVLARQIWEKQQLAYKQYWPSEPVLESIVVFGVSESQAVIKTLDNVIPRTLADTISTAETFRLDKDGKLRKSSERKELSKMLDTAIDLVWRRTHAGEGQVLHYQTHSASFDFAERHKKLEDCVKHLFEENSGRALTKLSLSAGQCAGLMYLMASSASDVDAYLAKRDESVLDWSLWEKAEDFWVALAGDSDDLKPVGVALKSLVDPDSETGGPISEKHATLIKAWELFSKDEPITEEALQLDYVTDTDGITSMNRPWPTLLGIDLGDPAGAPKKEKLSKEEVEAMKKQAREDKAKEQQEKIKRHGVAAGSSITPIQEQVRELHEKHPGLILVFASKTGDYNAFCDDADILSRTVKAKSVKRTDGVSMVQFPGSDFETFVQVLQGLGNKIGVCRHSIDGSGVEVTEVAPRKGKKTETPAVKTTPVKEKDAQANGSSKKVGKKSTPLRGGTGK